MRPLAPPLAKDQDDTQYKSTWRDPAVAAPPKNGKLFFDEFLGIEARAARRSSEDGVLTEFQVQLREQGEGLAVNLSDVGAGAAQILPIIIQMVVGSPGITVIGEQPELHLHPRAQARLGDLFIAARQRGIRCIIETHSEHLLLRLRRRIRYKALTSQDVGIIYVDRDRGRSICVPLRLADDGSLLDPWPRGFFPERFDELFGQEVGGEPGDQAEP